LFIQQTGRNMNKTIIRGCIALTFLIGTGSTIRLIPGLYAYWQISDILVLTAIWLFVHAPIIVVAIILFPRSSKRGKTIRLFVVVATVVVSILITTSITGVCFALSPAPNGVLSFGYDAHGRLVVAHTDPLSSCTELGKHYHDAKNNFRYAVSPWLPANLVALSVLILIEYLNHRYSWRPTYIEYYRQWRHPTGCYRCGYNLIGNESGICPECGQKIAKKVRETLTTL